MRTRIAVGVSVLVLILAMANLFAGRAQKAVNRPVQAEQRLATEPPILDQGARLNPLKIALLKWYLAESSTYVKVGSQPYGVCFDGANIWTGWWPR